MRISKDAKAILEVMIIGLVFGCSFLAIALLAIYQSELTKGIKECVLNGCLM